MKYRIWFTISIFMIQTSLYAQVADKGFPSPNAAALGKYADYPVSYFTGVPNIHIPLYTLKDGAAVLPISLSYHASGIKVAEVASWVGMGWTLNAGGVITRTIKGVPDEGSNNPGDGGPKGYYKDYGLTNFPTLDMVNNPLSTIKRFIDDLTDKKGVDGEPDIYTINVNGFVGKFVFDEKRNVRFLSQTDATLSVEYNGGQFQTWTLTTPNGVQYIFGENNAREKNIIVGSSDLDNDATTSWYVTKIIYPNHIDTLVFNYARENYSYNNLQSEFTIANDWTKLNDKNPNYGYLQYQLYGVVLASIESKNIHIQFRKATERKDVSGGSRLEAILVSYKNLRKLIDKILLDYDYFKSPIGRGTKPGTKDTIDTYRLKLVSLRKGLEMATPQIPPYTFEYYEDVVLPRRCSYSVDHWGYANDHENLWFTPDINGGIIIPEGKRIMMQNREPTWPYTRACTLKKIKNPLGSSTTFEFEPNSITTDTVTGGIRIKKIIIEDSITKQKQIKNFDYSITSSRSSGVLFRRPAYWAELFNEYHPTSSTAYATDGAADKDLSIGLFAKFAQSPLPLQDYQGYSVGYTKVKEYVSTDTSNGYNVYYYQAKPKITNTTRLQTANFLIAGKPNGKWNDIAPENLNYGEASKRGKLYPFEPLQIDFYNGLLTKQETYNGKGTLLQSTSYSYEDTYTENNWIRGFIADRLLDSVSKKNVYPFSYYKYRIGKLRLRTQQANLYDSITGKFATTAIRYAYESSNHLQPTRQTTINSLGDTIENVIRYSFDFDNNALSGGVITEMKNENILAPLRVETWKNNNLISCGSTEYAKNTVGGSVTVVPIKTYALESKKKLSAADIGFNKSFSGNINSLNGSASFLKPQSFYSYNDQGLLQQQGKIGDIPQSYIWNDNHAAPIAIAANTTPSDIAYTSFEIDGAGGWSIGSADRNTTTYFTGAFSYDLSKGNISKTSLNSSKNYWVSYWAKGASVNVSNTVQTIQGVTKNGYTLWKKKISGTTSLTISGSGMIDELRLYPDGAHMISYTYLSGVGVSSQSDGSAISFYEYDELNRLRLVRDIDNNIVQQYCYSMAGTPISCNGAVYKNKAISNSLYKNDCRPGFVASKVTYAIPMGKYMSIISQADADKKAEVDLYENGQAYANANGTCTTTYVKLSYENVMTTPDLVTGDIVLHFYEDAACTIPKTVTNFYVQCNKNISCSGPTNINYDNSVTCNGSYYYIATDAILYQKNPFTGGGIPPGSDECFFSYVLVPGSNYLIKH